MDTKKGSLIGFKRCQQGHLLGNMRRSGHVTVLELFRQAINYGQDMPESVDVIAVVYTGMEIRCSVCGGVISWYQPVDQIDVFQIGG